MDRPAPHSRTSPPRPPLCFGRTGPHPQKTGHPRHCNFHPLFHACSNQIVKGNGLNLRLSLSPEQIRKKTERNINNSGNTILILSPFCFLRFHGPLGARFCGFMGRLNNSQMEMFFSQPVLSGCSGRHAGRLSG